MDPVELLRNIWEILIALSQRFNEYLLSYAGGFMLLAAAIFALLAYRKAAKTEKYQQAMERLADAIVRSLAKDKDKED